MLLIGGGAGSVAVQQLAPGIFEADVEVPEPGEYVALGAARQAAWALAGTSEPPDWQTSAPRTISGEPQPEVRAKYAALRDSTA